MTPAWIALTVFAVCYILFVVLPQKRALTACGGALILILTGVLPIREALCEAVSWNVMGLFFGTLVLAELFMESRMPAVLAERLVDSFRSERGAMLALCALSGGISMFVENVAVVLLLAPVALSLAKRLKRSPVPLLIGIAVSSNLQGTATMIGDPPSMIFAGYMKMGFWDFFLTQGKPGIFFAVQTGAVASLLVLAWIFRDAKGCAQQIDREQALSKVPTCFLLLLVLGLSCATMVDPDFAWFAGCWTMLLCFAALIWNGRKSLRMVKTLDWDTTFFLIGVFILVAGLSGSGWMDKLAGVMANWAGGSQAVGFIMIVLLSVVVSGFVDNVPFLLVMIPVVQRMSDQMGVGVQLLMYGLLIGACLGGNLTPIGASANVVTLGILKKQGHLVTFRDFAKIGLPFTIAAVAAACGFVWIFWG